MSLLSAGKQITVGNERAFGRGLFIPDPQQAERKARKQNEYQEELRIQMEQAKRRKQQQKRKEMQEDLKLEQKINEEIMKEQERKNEKPNQKIDKAITQPQQKMPLNKIELSKVENKERRREESPTNYKFDFRANTDMNRTDNPYLPKRFDILQAEQQRYYDESNSQRLRGMREVLQQKMIEIYKKIKQSQNLEIDKEIDLIRKKIASSNTTYDSQNPKIQQFQGEYSHFYRIPKKQNYYEQSRVKNLDYDSTSYKRKENIAVRDFKPVTQQKIAASRHNVSRESGQSNQELWGVKKGKNNYLGNREAMDYQLNRIMSHIDDKLEQHAQP